MLTVRSPTLSHFTFSNMHLLSMHKLSLSLSLSLTHTHTHTYTHTHTHTHKQTHTHTHTHTHTSVEVAFPAIRDYGAVAVTCWDGGDTLSLTKEINFPVPWPSCKAALKGRRGGLLSPSFFLAGQIMAQQKKQLHYLCISVSPLSLMRTGVNDENKKVEMLKVARKREEIGRGCYMIVYVCGYVFEFPGVMQTHFFFQLCEFITFSLAQSAWEVCRRVMTGVKGDAPR